MQVNDLLKELAKSAAYYKYDRALWDSFSEEIHDPFVKVFFAVCNLMKYTAYSYYDYPFFTEIMGLLRHKDYLYYNNIENCNHPNHRLLHKLRKLDAKSVMLIPFRNSKNQPLLILAVISNSGEFDAKSIYEYVKPYENSIKQALM